MLERRLKYIVHILTSWWRFWVKILSPSFFIFIEGILQNPAEGVAASHHKNGCVARLSLRIDCVAGATTWGCRRPFRRRGPPAWGSEFRWERRRRHSYHECCSPAPRPQRSSSGPETINANKTSTLDHTIWLIWYNKLYWFNYRAPRGWMVSAANWQAGRLEFDSSRKSLELFSEKLTVFN